MPGWLGQGGKGGSQLAPRWHMRGGVGEGGGREEANLTHDQDHDYDHEENVSSKL